MYSETGTQGLLEWVSPFGDLRVKGYLRLSEAYRSLSRPSSPADAKASPVCPCLLPTITFGLSRNNILADASLIPTPGAEKISPYSVLKYARS